MNSNSSHLDAGLIDAVLPQTQCTRCGYPSCRAYAQAIASGLAGINQCPPGGDEGIARLASVTGHSLLPLNPANGTEGPRHVAVIDENWCIGCTLCLDACPTDAILGSNKLMHTVIESHCTGCELCIPVCPVDCIGLENVTGERTGWAAWSDSEAGKARIRYDFHSKQRQLRAGFSPKAFENSGENTVELPDRLPNRAAEPDRKRAVIEAALAQARAARQGKG